MVGESGELVAAWVKRYEIMHIQGKNVSEAQALLWASIEVDEICRENPQNALKVIANILGSTENEYALAMLAAGPLEILLANHGKEVIADVERLAKTEPRFRTLLKGVWQNLMDDQTWGRVLKAAKG
jgi:hypothetical protein